MNKSLHAVFNILFGNAYFRIAVSFIQGQELRFSAISQNSESEKSIFCQFEFIFLNV